MTNLLEILKNNLNNIKKMQRIVFGIEIDIRKFTAKLANKKLEKMVKITKKVLAKQLVTFLDIQFLIRLFSFSS